MSRTGMAVGRVVGANGVMVIADLLGFRVPLEANPNHEGGLTLGSAFQGRADYSGATVPGSHRLPRLVSTRPMIKSAVSRVNKRLRARRLDLPIAIDAVDDVCWAIRNELGELHCGLIPRREARRSYCRAVFFGPGRISPHSGKSERRRSLDFIRRAEWLERVRR